MATFTQLVPADHLNASFAGKSPFFDQLNGIKWDGKQAFVYQDAQLTGATSGANAGAGLGSESVNTAIPAITLGNGTAPPLSELQGGIHSAYILEGAGAQTVAIGH